MTAVLPETVPALSGETDLVFEPLFYMWCCRFSVRPGASSEKFDVNLAKTLCCPAARGLFEEVFKAKIQGIDHIRPELGKIVITPFQGANREKISEEVRAIIMRHPDIKSW